MLAKSKLNSIGTLISQALIDMEITHEESITVLKEKDKYQKMKENLRTENKKTRNYETEWYKIKDLNEKHSKVIEHFISSKKIFFSCLCIKCTHLALKHGVQLILKQ